VEWGKRESVPTGERNRNKLKWLEEPNKKSKGNRGVGEKNECFIMNLKVGAGGGGRVYKDGR